MKKRLRIYGIEYINIKTGIRIINTNVFIQLFLDSPTYLSHEKNPSNVFKTSRLKKVLSKKNIKITVNTGSTDIPSKYNISTI